MTTNCFHPSLLLLFLDPGSGMGKNQDPGSGINIPDSQHWLYQLCLNSTLLNLIKVFFKKKKNFSFPDHGNGSGILDLSIYLQQSDCAVLRSLVRPPSKPTRLPGDPARPLGDPARPPGDPARPPGDPARPHGDPARPLGDPARPPYGLVRFPKHTSIKLVLPNLLAVTIVEDGYTFRVGVFELAALFSRSPGETAGRIAVKVRLMDNLLAYDDGSSFPVPLWLRTYGNWHRWYFDLWI
jgi:hypothetical protein